MKIGVTVQPSVSRRSGPSGPHVKAIAQKTPEESRTTDLEGTQHLCREAAQAERRGEDGLRRAKTFHAVFKWLLAASVALHLKCSGFCKLLINFTPFIIAAFIYS